MAFAFQHFTIGYLNCINDMVDMAEIGHLTQLNFFLFFSLFKLQYFRDLEIGICTQYFVG